MMGVLTEARPHRAAFNWVPVDTVTVVPPAPPVVPPFSVEKPTWPEPPELEPLDDEELEDELLDEELEEEEEELERVLLEEEQYSLIIRRSFHTTPRAKK